MNFSLIYPHKKSHAALVYFYFCILIVEGKHNNIKTTLCNTIPSGYSATLNWENSIQLGEMHAIRILDNRNNHSSPALL